MKLTISELMEQCSAASVDLTADIDTEAVKQNVLARIQAEPPKGKRFKPTVLLVAAAVMTLLVGTAVATGRDLRGWFVDDPDEATRIYAYEEDGGIKYVKQEFPDAAYAMSLDFEEPQENLVYYKLNWLPYPAHDPWPKPVDTADWLPNYEVIENDGYYTNEERPYQRNGEMLYQVRVSPLQETDTVYYFNGEVISESTDVWNGMSRLKLTIDYKESAYVYDYGAPVNYLILVDSENRVMIYIAGTLGFADLEKIAKNLEIKVSDTVDPNLEYLEELRKENPLREQIGTPISIMDLGRG